MLKRFRSIHRKMSFAAFERLPRRPGWKHEYYDGCAHLRPAPVMVTFRLDLAQCPPNVPRRLGLRSLTPNDAQSLVEPFLAAFAKAPEYADYSARQFRKAAAKYFLGFFGSVRGESSPVSQVAESDGRIVGAALVKDRASGPFLDCLFVRPEHWRKGWATALLHRVVALLRKQGATHLHSCAMLANEMSIAWHEEFGFKELPDLWVASHRWRCYQHEVERHRALNDLAEEELAQLIEMANHWGTEVVRLEKWEEKDFRAVHPRLD